MDIMDTAISAARKAGLQLKESLGRAGRVEFKGAVDIVTEMDIMAENLIVAAIRERFPDHGILTEESTEAMPLHGSPYRWIIDPLDGTTNYAHGYPAFCVSIAFEEKGVVMSGVVYGPMLDELFTSEKGNGAYLNGKRISVSSAATLNESLLATGFPYDVRTSDEDNLDHFSNFAVRSQAIRRAGSAALDLSYVGCGRFDGFWEMKLKPWDIAAGALIVEEAGGRVTGFRNNPLSRYSADVVATNGLIHDEMLNVLNIRGKIS
ncbi:MAG: inositol monophosphatase [Deltaproteobacteria bacterium]|nr:inositol monophosphatase [Deltaproteobacteria bacterium]